VELRSKSGKSLSRYFPEVLALLEALPNGDFVLDGELVVPVGSSLSFDALQQRLHPAATRVRRLAHETPATFVLFDCLMTFGSLNLLAAPLSERRTALERLMNLFGDHDQLRLSPYRRDRKIAQRWLDNAGGALDGVIAKDLNAGYLPGERAMLKIKRLRTADCVVGGFRYGTDSREVGSLLLGLFDAQGKLDHVGYTSSIARADRGKLTKKLESLIRGPGFTGKSPGAPSQWSDERSAAWKPLCNVLVVEACYDHVTSRRFWHGTKLLRWRPDKAPNQCTFDQLEQEARPKKLGQLLFGKSASSPGR
jgi:ATP-dependent DNA ligase